MYGNLFAPGADEDRITIPYTRPRRLVPPGPDSEPEEDYEENWRRSRAHIKVFPNGERPRPLSRASSVATYEGSEADFEWDDVCEEVDTDEWKRDREEIADWLLCSDPQAWHSPRSVDTMPVPFELSQVSGSLFLQLLHALLLYLKIVPKYYEYVSAIPDHFRRSGCPEKPLADDWYFEHPNIRDRYRVPVLVTREARLENVERRPERYPMIYRFPKECKSDSLTMTGRLHRWMSRNVLHVDNNCPAIQLGLYGQRCKDVGFQEESWHLVRSEEEWNSLRECVARRQERFWMRVRKAWVRWKTWVLVRKTLVQWETCVLVWKTQALVWKIWVLVWKTLLRWKTWVLVWTILVEISKVIVEALVVILRSLFSEGSLLHLVVFLYFSALFYMEFFNSVRLGASASNNI